MFDEVHCFFTLEDDCKKKAETHMISILCAGASKGSRSLATLRPRSVVFSDATDLDLPYVLRSLNIEEAEYTRVCADPQRLRDRGYISTADFVHFTAAGVRPMRAPFSGSQRFGKDHEKLLPCKPAVSRKKLGLTHVKEEEGSELRTYSGRQFASTVTTNHFDPNLLAFFKDALVFAPPTNHKRFLLELSSPSVSEEQDNAVEHHAACVARLFPGVLALAESGKGCVHVDDSNHKRTFPSHRDAYKVLQSTPTSRYYGAPKYLISNVGYGSVQYAFSGSPVTHLYIGFTDTDKNNILVKAQGLGRGCGYVRDDLALCGVDKVRVLCTWKHFDDMSRGVYIAADEAHEQIGDLDASIHTTNTIKRNWPGHRGSTEMKAARLTSTVCLPRSGDGASTSNHIPTTRGRARVLPSGDINEELYCSIETFIDIWIQENDLQLCGEKDFVISDSPQYELDLHTSFPEATITSKVVFLTGTSAQHFEAMRTAREPSCTPAHSAFGIAARNLPVSVHETFQ